MNSQWKSFLEDYPPRTDGQGDLGLPQDSESPACILCDLSHLGLIAVSGDDSLAFLQGQTTNDLRDVSETHSQLNSICNPKGRMLANFRVIQRGGTFYLQMPAAAVGGIIRHLSMFILRSRVSLVDAGDSLIRIGLAGACAEDLLQRLAIGYPGNVNEVIQAEQLTVIRLPDPRPRFELIAPLAPMTGIWGVLARDAAVMSASHWSLLDIRAGIPTIYPETAGLFVPQMTNMQLIDGVSFTKGCYTGQEVVARMKYLGKLKRRMYLADLRSDLVPHPGDELYSASSGSGQGAGRIVDVQSAGGDLYEVLAVIEIASAENRDVRMGIDGPPLDLRDLPYPYEVRDRPPPE